MSNSWMEFSSKERYILACTPKPVALVSCLVSTMIAIYIFRDKEKMGKMYHRLTLGMCISSALNAINLFLMSWAIPLSYRDGGYIHASGTVETCTASGFLFQLGFVVQYYYVSLSIYVFMALKHEFRIQEIQWIEKYLHIGVFIYPLSSAIYLSWREMFNPIGVGCWINSYPQGCKSETYGPCIRGPQDPTIYAIVFGGVPAILNLSVTTGLICACYVNEQIKHKRLLKSGRLKGKQIFLERARREKSKLIASQGIMYLLAFYLSHLFGIIATIVQSFKPSFFPTTILSTLSFPMDGLFFTVAYVFLLEKKECCCTGKHKEIKLTADQSYQNKQPERRRSFSIFDGADEERWRMFGVYIGSDSDSDSVSLEGLDGCHKFDFDESTDIKRDEPIDFET